MNTREIIEDWLKENCYDGLCYPDECGCQIGDLMPCDSYCGHCRPGYLHGDGLMYTEKVTKGQSVIEKPAGLPGQVPPIVERCEDCAGTGWYGDNGPGILGNSEIARCGCDGGLEVSGLEKETEQPERRNTLKSSGTWEKTLKALQRD